MLVLTEGRRSHRDRYKFPEKGFDPADIDINSLRRELILQT
jgi:hypothetical protein